MRLTQFAVCCWLAVVFRESLRLLLTAKGQLDFRGWYFGFDGGLWPSYTTMWDFVTLLLAGFMVRLFWRQLEWKQ